MDWTGLEVGGFLAFSIQPYIKSDDGRQLFTVDETQVNHCLANVFATHTHIRTHTHAHTHPQCALKWYQTYC